MPSDPPLKPQSLLAEKASTDTPPSVLSTASLSDEDTMILYAVLQDLADEIRRIDRERKKTKMAQG